MAFRQKASEVPRPDGVSPKDERLSEILCCLRFAKRQVRGSPRYHPACVSERAERLCETPYWLRFGGIRRLCETPHWLRFGEARRLCETPCETSYWLRFGEAWRLCETLRETPYWLRLAKRRVANSK